MNKFEPLFLQNYDLFEELEHWKAGEQSRNWQLNSWQWSGVVNCWLSWTLDGQSCGIAMSSMSPKEAVYKALEAFREYEDQK